MAKKARFIIAVVAVVIGFGGFWYLTPKEASFGMFSANDSPTNRLVLSFIATIIGVVLGSFYRQLRQLQEQGVTNITGAFVAKVFTSIDLWLGLVSAPIVYALLLQSTSDMTLPGLLIVALENGFCCLIIVNGFVGRAAAAGVPPVAAGTPSAHD